MRSWLARHWDILTYKADGAAASRDGVLLWDAAGPYPVVSNDGAWETILTDPGGATADQFLGWDGSHWRPATITPTEVDGGIDLVVLFNNGVI
jgi:hypothetical protein